MRHDDAAFASGLERFEDVQQEGVVAVLGRWDAVLESFEFVFGGYQSVAPRFVAEGRIGDGEVECFQAGFVVVFEMGR